MNAQPKSSLYAVRASFAALAAVLLAAACATPGAPVEPSAAAANPASLDAAISGPQRAEKARERDIYRHPKETLQFFELAPSQTVLEIAPGGGWYTEILAPYLHDHGTLYEAEYDGPQGAPSAEAQAGRAAFARKLAATPAVYGNVVVGTLHKGQFTGFPADASVDRVLTFRNIHNWIKDGADRLESARLLRGAQARRHPRRRGTPRRARHIAATDHRHRLRHRRLCDRPRASRGLRIDRQKRGEQQSARHEKLPARRVVAAAQLRRRRRSTGRSMRRLASRIA